MSLELRFQKKTTDILAIKKASYAFLNRCAVDVVEDDGEYICNLQLVDKGSPELEEKLAKDFRIEVLDQELRSIIKDETEATRNLILAYTFSEVSWSTSE